MVKKFGQFESLINYFVLNRKLFTCSLYDVKIDEEKNGQCCWLSISKVCQQSGTELGHFIPVSLSSSPALRINELGSPGFIQFFKIASNF